MIKKKAFGFVLPIVICLSGMASFAQALPPGPNPKTLEKLVGTWKLKMTENPLPQGASARIEFLKTGELNIFMEFQGKVEKIEGRWKLLSDTELETVVKLPMEKERKERLKLAELSETKLITIDESQKKDEFEKLPPKKP